MFKRLPGDETRNLVTTTPDTAVVFRPAVVTTPAIITIVICAWRLLAGIVRAIWRHPVAVTTASTPATLALLYDWQTALLLSTPVPAGLVAWALTDRASFARWVGYRLLVWWRLVWIYRRHWHPVMTVSGLGRRLRGRDYLPRLDNVTCTSWADTVTVRMLDGQALKDWIDRTDHLAHGFGAPSCRVTVARAGRLTLTFPRRDPLATPFPALPIPAAPTVGPIEIGKQEDGQPWRLKVHGTHVLVAGATGAGKGSMIWSTIRALLPAVRAGLVEVWAFDPKLMELSFGRPLFGDRYAATPQECADLLDQAVTVMQSRAARFAGLQRSHTPTVEDPFVLVVVDEVAFLTAYQADRQLKQRISLAGPDDDGHVRLHVLRRPATRRGVRAPAEGLPPPRDGMGPAHPGEDHAGDEQPLHGLGGEPR
ncbi:FtsK/SpoIIIE domain-containing protein [Nonomuraea muscovyensis]|uniref:FtsK/SpoIIIE domain-containing protein n=1 Tax=Nonomuraea muscovyensis TaxID=1124761 RepID=UPI0033F9545C